MPKPRDATGGAGSSPRLAGTSRMPAGKAPGFFPGLAPARWRNGRIKVRSRRLPEVGAFVPVRPQSLAPSPIPIFGEKKSLIDFRPASLLYSNRRQKTEKRRLSLPRAVENSGWNSTSVSSFPRT